MKYTYEKEQVELINTFIIKGYKGYPLQLYKIRKKDGTILDVFETLLVIK